jgi:structural maintenance of chromosome 3 (chondroitin sulfate proteoglycan 6)
MSFSRAQGKRRHFYTAKEKILFSKITLYRSELNEKRDLYRHLIEAEATLNDMVEDCQREKDRYVAEIFDRFQAHFAAVFRAIAGGRSDVRLKKNHERGRSVVREKLRSAITIMVSFEAEREVTRRWNEFSGGQKSVLAFCVLMALQKCQPASFYVLDEVDAALDPVYLSRIVEFIRKESAHSQYFISSFKQEMLEFPEDICNYYLVSMTDRVSRISRISQDDAKAALANIL